MTESGRWSTVQIYTNSLEVTPTTPHTSPQSVKPPIDQDNPAAPLKAHKNPPISISEKKALPQRYYSGHFESEFHWTIAGGALLSRVFVAVRSLRWTSTRYRIDFLR